MMASTEHEAGSDASVSASSPIKQSAESAPWRAVRLLLAGEEQTLITALLFGLALGLIGLVLPITVQALVNTAAFGTVSQPLFVLCAILSVALLAGVVIRAMQVRLVEDLQRRVAARVLSTAARRLRGARPVTSSHVDLEELTTRAFDVFSVQKSLAALMVAGLDALLICMVGLGLLAFYHPLLLAFDVVLVFAVLGVLLVLGRGGVRTSVKESKAKYAAVAWLADIARGRLTSAVGTSSDASMLEADDRIAAYLDARASHFRVFERQFVAFLLLQAAASVALLGVGAWLVTQGELSIGQLVAAELVVTAVVAALVKVGSKVESAYDIAASADKVMDLLSIPTLDERGGEAPSDPCVSIRWSDTRRVTLPSGREAEALTLSEPGPSVVIAPHERVGQSELVHCIRDPLAVPDIRIRLDDVDLRDIAPDGRRATFAVGQGAELLRASIRTNLGGQGVSPARLWRALRLAGLEDWARALPEGLETLLGPNHVWPSRDIALQLTIARVLASSATVLVLDGTLDSLSPLHRGEVARALQLVERPLVVLTAEPALSSLFQRSFEVVEVNHAVGA